MNSFAVFVIIWILVSIAETMGAEFRALPSSRHTPELIKTMVALKVGGWLGFFYLIFAALDCLFGFLKGAFS